MLKWESNGKTTLKEETRGLGGFKDPGITANWHAEQADLAAISAERIAVLRWILNKF